MAYHNVTMIALRAELQKASGPLSETEVSAYIDQVCCEVTKMRQRPLAVLYYPGPYGSMEETDVDDCHRVLRNAGIVKESPLADCDVLVHTMGGSPIAGYRLAECLRDFVQHLVFLVPEQAYSAGTLLCFAGNQVRLGHCAGLSPIDITQLEVKQSGHLEVELTSLDYYLNFAAESQNKIQKILQGLGIGEVSDVGANLLCELVRQVQALKVGEYYRARTLTERYGKELLMRYMLAGKPNASGICKNIMRGLLYEAPTHELHMDYHMCSDLGLELAEMDTRESDATKIVVTTLTELATQGRICKDLSDELKQPFIAFFPFQGKEAVLQEEKS